MGFGKLFSNRSAQELEGLFKVPVARQSVQQTNKLAKYFKNVEYRARTNYVAGQNIKYSAYQLGMKVQKTADKLNNTKAGVAVKEVAKALNPFN
jgi:hypothetical protein